MESKSIKYTIIIVLAVFIVSGLLYTYGPDDTASDDRPISENKPMNDLTINTVTKGSGPETKTGDTIIVHYVGTLENGTQFDSSLDRGLPFSFTLGQGRVIEGWDRGLIGMKQGEKRILTIPSHLGYGELGTPDGTILPGATLIFEVELLGIQ
jgi:FKBP-type peptidyl-prolyl cis-trans isomerase